MICILNIVDGKGLNTIFNSIGDSKLKVIDIPALLEDKFDIPINEYFQLDEESKNIITKLLVEVHKELCSQDLISLFQFDKFLNFTMTQATLNEEYELCDILYRFQKILKLKTKRAKNRRII